MTSTNILNAGVGAYHCQSDMSCSISIKAKKPDHTVSDTGPADCTIHYCFSFVV